MKRQENQSPMILAQTDFGKVYRCRCGGYHVSYQQTTLHLSKEGFNNLKSLLTQVQMREKEGCLSLSKKQGRRGAGMGKQSFLSLVSNTSHPAEEGS